MKRRAFMTLLGGATVSWPLAARAQQQKVPVVGFLFDSPVDRFPDRMRAFRVGLATQGYVEGRNVKIEYRWAADNQLTALAAGLVQQNVAVIAAIAPPAALAAQRATTSVPIVFQAGVDPVGLGLVKSLSRPGGNITGIASLNLDVAAKRLELLHELVPAATRMGLLVHPANSVNTRLEGLAMQKAAQALGLQLHIINASSEGDLDAAIETARQLRVGGLSLGIDQLFTGNAGKLAALAIAARLPTIGAYREYPSAGGLMSYGGDIAESWRLVGVYVGRVLNGDKPSDLPVQQSTKFDLVVNLKTAKALGLTVPQTVLATADEVIE